MTCHEKTMTSNAMRVWHVSAFIFILLVCHMRVASVYSQVKLPAKPVSPRTSIPRNSLDSWVDSLIARARLKREAKTAMSLLDEALQSSELNEVQKKKLSAERVRFKEFADKGLVRNGQSWITVDEESQRITQSDQLIERGVTFVRTNDQKKAKEAFEEASKTDLNGVRADFILGMMNSPMVAFSPKTAEDHFKEILRRSPQLPCAMNNLALTLVRQGEVTSALNIWRDLERQEPGSELVLYNVTKLVDDIGSKRLQSTKAVAKQVEKFYADLVSGSPADTKIQPSGWRYAQLTLTADEEDRTSFDATSVPVKSIAGSGFVIQSGCVITALHGVRDCNTISVVFPGGRECNASLDATVELKNIALLKIDDPEAAAAPVKATVPDKSAKLYQLACSMIGSQPPVVEVRDLRLGFATAPPGADCFVLEARRKHGYVGGPICDEYGNVIGMASSISNLDSGLTPVVPVSHILSLVNERTAKVDGVQPSKILFDGPEKISEQMGKSVCQIIVSRKYHTFGIGESDDPRYALDRMPSCSCSGTGKVRCPNKGCNNGQVSFKRKVVVARSPIAGDILGLKVFREACPQCNGTGTVPCPCGK